MRGQRHAPAALRQERDPLSIVYEAGWAPGPVWTGAENFVHAGIQSPDRPTRSESLYWLSYPASSAIGRNIAKLRRQQSNLQPLFTQQIVRDINLISFTQNLLWATETISWPGAN